MGNKNGSRRHRVMGREDVLMQMEVREMDMDIVQMHRSRRKGIGRVLLK